ncbi:MarR family winged helix-turn-helix transcriptional regulator [Hymenobacter terricola]|uniref:MarR family winged helix-turn-helix transcriptional regulator n=1 Tax=Hymenobacter terricola TaxID=2819236 RepID=UPI001B303596|nr:MarR family transcriptional regulator [Hymenobacter terricola]
MRTNLLRVSGWLRFEINALLEPFGITQPQFNILRILRGQQGQAISTLEIRGRMIDSKMSDTSRLVDRLAAKALITKTPSTADKRLVDVVISAQGLAVLGEIDTKMAALDDILKSITTDEVQALNRLLDKISAGITP